MNDDELLQAIERIMDRVVERALETYGLKKPPSSDALRMRRHRERKRNNGSAVGEQKRNAETNETVTLKGQRRNKGVTRQPNAEAPTHATWKAYSEAYRERYGVDPVRNAAVNGQLAQFVGRVGGSEAPAIAAFFVRANRGLYVSAKHAVALLLKNAEAIRTEWATGRSGTETEARQADQTQARGNVWGKLISEAEERERNEAK